MASKLVSQNLRRLLQLRTQTLKCSLNRSMATSIAFEDSLLNAPETELSALSSGLRIASEDSGGETCTIGLWVDAGSRFESESNNGVAHFVEHMAFKGTQNRSQLQLETEIESLGAHLNAYTSREQTAYYAKCLKKDIPAVVNILSDIVQNPLLDESTIEKERGVILREMHSISTDPGQEEVAFDHLHSVAFQGTPLGMSVLGTSANVNSLSKSDMANYISANYTAPRMVLAASGGVDHTALVGLAEANFSDLSSSSTSGTQAPCRFTGSEVTVRDDDIPFARIILALEGCGWINPDYFTLMVANMIIGSWDKQLAGSHNLFGKLAQTTHEYHLCESYSSFNMCYTDTGLFGVNLLIDRMMLDDMIYLIQGEWMRLSTSITESEVSRAKKSLKTNLLLQLDGTTQSCEDIGRQVLAYGRRISLPELNERIDLIDAKAVKDICTKYIYDKCLTVAAVGPVEGLPQYARMRGQMYWLRV